MNVNSHFKIQRKNGECVSPISEINHLTNVRPDMSDVMFTISSWSLLTKDVLTCPDQKLQSCKASQCYYSIILAVVALNTHKAFNKYW